MILLNRKQIAEKVVSVKLFNKEIKYRTAIKLAKTENLNINNILKMARS